MGDYKKIRDAMQSIYKNCKDSITDTLDYKKSGSRTVLCVNRDNLDEFLKLAEKNGYQLEKRTDKKDYSKAEAKLRQRDTQYKQTKKTIEQRKKDLDSNQH